eukprot:Skav213990  [mRNA]  locus=scaffold2843:108348:112938:+ [translate_table: standard]
MGCLRWVPVVTVALALADSAPGPPEAPADGQGHLAAMAAMCTSGMGKDGYGKLMGLRTRALLPWQRNEKCSEDSADPTATISSGARKRVDLRNAEPKLGSFYAQVVKKYRASTAGQYVMLHWKGEWHPFTLTSAPEERHLTLHIRASATLDWCSALRRHLMLEAAEPGPG